MHGKLNMVSKTESPSGEGDLCGEMSFTKKRERQRKRRAAKKGRRKIKCQSALEFKMAPE